MKTRLSIILAAVLLALVAAAPDPAAAARGTNSWTSLGKLHVKDRVDRDTLRVGIKKGSFDSIRHRHATGSRGGEDLPAVGAGLDAAAGSQVASIGVYSGYGSRGRNHPPSTA